MRVGRVEVSEQDYRDMRDDVQRLLSAFPLDSSVSSATIHLSTGTVILTRDELTARHWRLQAVLAASR